MEDKSWMYRLIDVGGAVVFEVEKDEEDSEKKDEMDDDTMFTGLGEDDKSKPSVAPRWVTRVFAADCLCRIILLCENDKAHFDLAAARSAQAKNSKGTNQAVASGFVVNQLFKYSLSFSFRLMFHSKITYIFTKPQNAQAVVV